MFNLLHGGCSVRIAAAVGYVYIRHANALMLMWASDSLSANLVRRTHADGSRYLKEACARVGATGPATWAAELCEQVAECDDRYEVGVLLVASYVARTWELEHDAAVAVQVQYAAACERALCPLPTPRLHPLRALGPKLPLPEQLPRADWELCPASDPLGKRCMGMFCMGVSWHCSPWTDAYTSKILRLQLLRHPLRWVMLGAKHAGVVPGAELDTDQLIWALSALDSVAAAAEPLRADAHAYHGREPLAQALTQLCEARDVGEHGASVSRCFVRPLATPTTELAAGTGVHLSAHRAFVASHLRLRAVPVAGA